MVKKIFRQTIMFSATMPPKVEQMAKKYLRNPIFIAIGDRGGKTSTSVTQQILWVKENQKKEKLLVEKEAEAKQKNILILGISVLAFFIALIGFLIYRRFLVQPLTDQPQQWIGSFGVADTNSAEQLGDVGHRVDDMQADQILFSLVGQPLKTHPMTYSFYHYYQLKTQKMLQVHQSGKLVN